MTYVGDEMVPSRHNDAYRQRIVRNRQTAFALSGISILGRQLVHDEVGRRPIARLNSE